jgi:hypothetical protein
MVGTDGVWQHSGEIHKLLVGRRERLRGWRISERF